MVEERHDQWPLSRAQMATPAWIELTPVWDKTFKPRTEGGESASECVLVRTSTSTFSSLMTIFAVAILDKLDGPALPLEFQVPILKQCFFKGTEGVLPGGRGWMWLTGSE